MKTNNRIALLAVLPLALALGACQPDNTTNTSADKAKADVARAGDQIKEKTDQTVVAMKDAAHDAANDIREKSAEAKPAFDDAAITASVKTDILKDPDLSVLKIDVDTKDGVVTLNGMADTDAAKTRAQQMASGVKGVKEVRNFLTVKHA